VCRQERAARLGEQGSASLDKARELVRSTRDNDPGSDNHTRNNNDNNAHNLFPHCKFVPPFC
jgi:hypothetical protein